MLTWPYVSPSQLYPPSRAAGSSVLPALSPNCELGTNHRSCSKPARSVQESRTTPGPKAGADEGALIQ